MYTSMTGPLTFYEKTWPFILKRFDNSTAMYKDLKYYTLVGIILLFCRRTQW
jgi:hypothetical protein